MDLAGPVQRVDALGRRRQDVAVEVGGPLLELGEVLDALEGALRAEQPLDVDAAQAGRVDAAAVALRADVADQVRRGRRVAVDVAVEAGHAAHAIGLFRLAVVTGVELLLRELRNQQAHAFQVLGIKDAVKDFVEIVDGHHFALGHIAQVGPGRQEDGRRELG